MLVRRVGLTYSNHWSKAKFRFVGKMNCGGFELKIFFQEKNWDNRQIHIRGGGNGVVTITSK